MLRKCFECVGGKIGIIPLPCQQETAHQTIKLLLVDRLLGSFGDDTACTDIVEIVQELSRIPLYLIGIYRLQCLYRLAFQSDIIIIGGVHDGIFRFGIEQPPQFF